MKRIGLALVLALRLCADDPKAAAPTDKDKKKDDSNVNVKVSLDKPDPAVTVSFSFKITLPTYCIGEGFGPVHEPWVVDPDSKRCRGDENRYERVNANIDDVISAFAKDTEYSVEKGDDSHILFFCAAKHCEVKTDRRRILDAVNALVHASPRYFQDAPVPEEADPAKLAAAIANYTEGVVTGRVLPSGKAIRLETDQKLDQPAIDDLCQSMKCLTSDKCVTTAKVFLPASFATRVVLPTFCLSGKLSDPPEASEKCDGGKLLAPAANAKDIAGAFGADKIKITADSNSSLIISCGDTKCDPKALGLITANARAMAFPKPAYIQDLTVLTGTANGAVADIVKWSNGAITGDIISPDKIRLKSDVPVDPGDIAALDDRLRDAGFGPAQVFPTDRLFYSDANSVVARLSTIPTLPTAKPAAPAAAPAATPATAATAATSIETASTPTAPPPPAASTYGMGLTSVGDSVVLSGNNSVSDGQRVRLLTLLDLPRPEVLLNLWSFQESNPSGKQITDNTTLIRSTVAIHNEALQNAIQYGWSYLSRQMQDERYFDTDFRNYLTQRYVADSSPCADSSKYGPSLTPIAAAPKEPDCIRSEDRKNWGFCPSNQYCLGYTEAFQPVRPTLTNILLGLMAAKDPVRAVFTTLGCMEGKFEVYGDECFKDRNAIKLLLRFTESSHSATANSDKEAAAAPQSNEKVTSCLQERRNECLDNLKDTNEPSCEDLDRAALYAQRKCGVPVALPLSCFTIQAAQSFVPFHGFSTFTARQLNNLAEANIPQSLEAVTRPAALPEAQLSDKARRVFNERSLAGREMTDHESLFSTSPLGLLRSATTNFLFHYKMAQQFPKEFSPYLLTHSAQELNAEFNPLVVAFNEDVSVFSEDLRQALENKITDTHWYNNKSLLADGSITVRGISGVESFVDTETMSAFSAPQYQTLPDVLNNLAGLVGNPTAPIPGSTTTSSSEVTNGNTSTTTSTTAPAEATAGGPLSSSLTSLLPSFLSRASLPVALASAVLPTPATAQIGRQLTLKVTPHSLPGASSAELDVNLIAQEDSPPSLYSDHGATKNTDPISRVAKHNIVSRVRVESVKLFEVSSFSALIERPRSNVPILPIPFVEIPIVGDLLSLPIRGAKVYHRSTAIVSAVIVPTAADLAYGLEFHGDREVVEEPILKRRFFMKVTSQDQLPWEQRRLYGFNQTMAQCFAAQSGDPTALRAESIKSPNPGCGNITFTDIAPDR